MDNTEKIRIELMQDKHLSEVNKISFEICQYHDRLLPDFFTGTTPDRFAQHYHETKDKAISFVAIKDDTVIGYLFAVVLDRPWQKRTPICHMEEVGILSAYRHQGIGTQLVNALHQECKKRNIPYMTLNVYDKNAGALQFYKKLGGEIISHRIDIKIT